MATDVIRSYEKDIFFPDKVGVTDIHGDGRARNLTINPSSEICTRKNSNDSEEQIMSSSSYIIASDVSDLSGDVDRWMNESNTSSPTKTTGIQSGRAPVAQRSTVTTPCAANSLWYLVAMVLPLFSVHNCVMTLRCTPSTVVNAAEVFVQHVNRLCTRVKAHIQRLARDRFASEVFAATMDVVLVVYALGFLFLSMYHATLIG